MKYYVIQNLDNGVPTGFGVIPSEAPIANGEEFNTEQEANARVFELGFNLRPYDKKRSASYPTIGEQLDKLYWDIQNGTLDATGSFATTIKAIKDAFPKDV